MKPRLLVLDDQTRYGRSLSRALSPEYEVILASSVEEAIAKTTDLAAVLCDIRLNEADPENRDGLRYIQWAAGQKGAPTVVAMSALDDPSLERDARTAGATLFLRKPIVLTQLREVLRGLLPQTGPVRENR